MGIVIVYNDSTSNYLNLIYSISNKRTPPTTFIIKNRSISIFKIYSNTEETYYWDIKIKYEDLIFTKNYEFYTEIKGAAPIRRYNDKCKINLDNLYYTRLLSEPGYADGYADGYAEGLSQLV